MSRAEPRSRTVYLHGVAGGPVERAVLQHKMCHARATSNPAALPLFGACLPLVAEDVRNLLRPFVFAESTRTATGGGVGGVWGGGERENDNNSQSAPRGRARGNGTAMTTHTLCGRARASSQRESTKRRTSSEDSFETTVKFAAIRDSLCTCFSIFGTTTASAGPQRTRTFGGRSNHSEHSTSREWKVERLEQIIDGQQK